MVMKLRTRVAKFFGFRTRDYKKTLMREAFLSLNSRDAISYYPELKEIYDIKEKSLNFYNQTLDKEGRSLETLKRNEDRAQFDAILALSDLLKNKKPSMYMDENNKEMVESLKAEELALKKYEQDAIFDKKMLNSPLIQQTYHDNYAKLSKAYYENPDKAFQQYPELEPLKTVEKNAIRQLSYHLDASYIDDAIQYYIHESIKQIASGRSAISPLEIAKDAQALKKSKLGRKDLKTPKKRIKTLKMIDFFSKDKIKTTGNWSNGNKALDKKVSDIEKLSKNIHRTQMKAAFIAYPKDIALDKHKELEPLYQKYSAALDYYKQKVGLAHAIRAADRLIEGDFDRLLNKQYLRAIEDYDLSEHLNILSDAQKLEEQSVYEGDLKNIESLEEIEAQNKSEIENGASIETNNIVHLNFKDRERNQIEIESDEINVNGENMSINTVIESIVGNNVEIEESYNDYIQNNYLDESAMNKLRDAINTPNLINDEPNHHQAQEKQDIVGSINIENLTSTAPKLNLMNLFDASHQSKTTKQETKFVEYDIKNINKEMNNQIESVATSLLGEPINKTAQELRFGTKQGSLIIQLKGEKSGLWYDHQSGVGGNMLQLIQSEKKIGFRQALEYAASTLGIEGNKNVIEKVDLTDIKNQNLTEDKIKKISYARQLANESRDIKGTLAETYLKEHRGIDPKFCSKDIRFLDSIKEPSTQKQYPAMLVVGKDKDGRVQGVQVTYLNQDATKAKDLESPKRSYGQIKGSNIAVHQGGSIIAIAEGVETALSVANANPNLTVFSSLGSMTNFSAQDFNAKGQTLIICADNDPVKSEAAFKANKASQELSEKGFNVLIAKPPEVGQDFNDILKEQGVDAVKSVVNNPIIHKLQENRTYQHIDTGLDLSKKRDRSIDNEIAI